MENANVKYLVGDAFTRMAELPDSSVDLILTSPPFLALRSYLPADHPNKQKEIGSENTPSEFIDVLLKLTTEWRRLLTPHGSLVVELGDTFSGSGGAGGDYAPDGLREGQPKFQQGQLAKYSDARGNPDGMRDPTFSGANTKTGGGSGWPLAKSLTLVPEAYRFALAYGYNPLRTRHRGGNWRDLWAASRGASLSPAGVWRIRNVIRWVRPNPPVGALGDKFRPATSELVVACVSKDRYFDLDAVREPFAREYQPEDEEHPKRKAKTEGQWATLGDWTEPNPGGAPPLDWWKISPKGYAGAHYAVWPSELCVKPIKAMCPREVCRECGKPRRRITENASEYQAFRDIQNAAYASGDNSRLGAKEASGSPGGWDQVNVGQSIMSGADKTTVGWSDCGHNNYRPGLVLDPFAGTGTTLAVAHGHGRDAIGIDIDERSAELARERVGPLFLEVVGSTDGLRV